MASSSGPRDRRREIRREKNVPPSGEAMELRKGNERRQSERRCGSERRDYDNSPDWVPLFLRRKRNRRAVWPALACYSE